MKELLHSVDNLKGKSSAIKMRSISKGLAFKYHYKGEASIEEEFQPARDGVDYVDVLNSVYNRLDYVIPIYKLAWMKKRTI